MANDGRPLIHCDVLQVAAISSTSILITPCGGKIDHPYRTFHYSYIETVLGLMTQTCTALHRDWLDPCVSSAKCHSNCDELLCHHQPDQHPGTSS